jgi:hypothetical protein
MLQTRVESIQSKQFSVFALLNNLAVVRIASSEIGSWPLLVNPFACYRKNGYLRGENLLFERRCCTLHALSNERKQADSPKVAMSHFTGQ